MEISAIIKKWEEEKKLNHTSESRNVTVKKNFTQREKNERIQKCKKVMTRVIMSVCQFFLKKIGKLFLNFIM